MQLPERPLVFAKSPSSVIGPVRQSRSIPS
jgi:hypothetical protein